MANAVGTPRVRRSNSGAQFQSFYSDLWAVDVPATFDTNITAGSEGEFTATVTGVRRGDVILGYATYGGDPEPNIFFWNFNVDTDNTINISVTNASGSSDTPLVTGFKLLIGRPTW